MHQAEPRLGHPTARQRGVALLAVESIDRGGTRDAIALGQGIRGMGGVHVLIYACE
jgi:hypothetical protein